ncbi:hypothetical protein OG455_16395 [Kitasatospora sp. NBC_01287]|uniref:hypothetical protein n=1 Tax=Kitasatospora sp. NBC_01287 TaxID=2903573 RepID=UPI0022526517|nr:hypothetical protein [Kitasatospora sp. NBC_01287]MCX4747084.1 hypothetical protein [Kitasatospora sp. NBC_01287]
MTNSAAVGGGGGSLEVNLPALSQATGALNGMALDAPNIGASADADTQAAAKALSGWATAGALDAVLQEWHSQVSSLTGQLHQNSAAMSATAAGYQQVNTDTSTLFSRLGR